MRRSIVIWTLCQFFMGGMSVFAQSAHTLWFNKPAQYFEETLVLGNGRMGASVFGGVNSDKIFLNDITLWSGEPVNVHMMPEAYKDLPAVREALKNEDYQMADKLNRNINPGPKPANR